MGISRILVFLGILLALSALVHWYFWLRLVRSPAWPGPWTRGASILLTCLALLLPGAMVLQRGAGVALLRPLLWISFTWMGLVLLLLVPLLAGEIVRLLWLLGGLFLRDPAGAGLRLSRGIALAALFAALLSGAAAMITALRPARVKEVAVALPNWPESLSGYTILQVSDLHVGPTLGAGFVRSLKKRMTGLRPDLIAVTGDLIDGEVPSVGPFLTAFSELSPPDGVYYVTGNHEYYSGVEPWVRFVRSLGFRVLRNERVTVRGAFDLAGVEDFHARGPLPEERPDLPRALQGRDPSRPVVLLAHQPAAVFESASQGVDFQISGHTHGGQIWPFHYIAGRFQPYLSGLHRVGGTLLYVSRGTGYWGPPMRLFAPPEITLFRIRRALSPKTG